MSETETTAAEVVDDALSTITEIIDHVPMAYVITAILVGMIIGVGVVLLMDDANEKRANSNEEVLVVGND